MSIFDPLSRIMPVDAQSPGWLDTWLIEEGFLTRKLQSITGNAHLIHHRSQWSQPQWWENFVLKLHNEQVFRREISIVSNDHLCWYAKTIIPKTSYTPFTDIFERLTTESLGDILFSEKQIQRQALCYYPVNDQCVEYYWPQNFYTIESDRVWLKLSHFLINDQFPFYLAELFLPGLLQCLKSSGIAIGD